jgi:hypothetical protein
VLSQQADPHARIKEDNHRSILLRPYLYNTHYGGLRCHGRLQFPLRVQPGPAYDDE